MSNSVFVEFRFWLLVLVSIGLPLWFYRALHRRRAISPTTVLMLGLALVVIAAVDIYLLRSLQARAAETESHIDDLFNSELAIGLYLIPAVFGGLGINLTSSVFARHLEAAERRYAEDNPEPVPASPAAPTSAESGGSQALTYYVAVVALMLVLPLLSIAVEAGVHHVPLSALLIGKWFVFWSVGLRLLLAGLRQMLQPRYTAEKILGIQGDESLVLVRELGFANVAIGCIGVASLALPGWRMAGALAGGIFYALAGFQHLMQPRRNRLENVAMVSDLWAAVVLLGCCTGAAAG